MFWQAPESLFGSETDTRRVSRRLRERISYFLAENAKDQKDLHDKVEACHGTRSDPPLDPVDLRRMLMQLSPDGGLMGR
jgi:hypothetical protein